MLPPDVREFLRVWGPSLTALAALALTLAWFKLRGSSQGASQQRRPAATQAPAAPSASAAQPATGPSSARPPAQPVQQQKARVDDTPVGRAVASRLVGIKAVTISGACRSRRGRGVGDQVFARVLQAPTCGSPSSTQCSNPAAPRCPDLHDQNSSNCKCLRKHSDTHTYTRALTHAPPPPPPHTHMLCYRSPWRAPQ